jgi:hypothetical protein
MSELMNEHVLMALIGMAEEGDYNAAHAVEGEIELRGLQDRYTNALRAVVVTDNVSVDSLELFKLIHATVEQRMKAARKVLQEGDKKEPAD